MSRISYIILVIVFIAISVIHNELSYTGKIASLVIRGILVIIFIWTAVVLIIKRVKK